MEAQLCHTHNYDVHIMRAQIRCNIHTSQHTYVGHKARGRVHARNRTGKCQQLGWVNPWAVGSNNSAEMRMRMRMKVSLTWSRTKVKRNIEIVSVAAHNDRYTSQLSAPKKILLYYAFINTVCKHVFRYGYARLKVIHSHARKHTYTYAYSMYEGYRVHTARSRY